MTVTKLRWTILTISFLVLVLGGLVGINLGGFLPTFACTYIGGARGGICFLWRLQYLLGSGTWEAIKVLGELFIYFSLLVILIGRAWCGWICPLAFLQNLLDLIRRKLHFGYIRFPERLRSGLNSVKWIFFFIALLVPLWVAYPFFAPLVARDLGQPFCQLCPGKYILPLFAANIDYTAVNFRSATTIVMSLLGLIFSVTVIMGAFSKRMFWCPYCPLGLLLGWYRKISFIKLKKDDQKCTMCEICYNVCPVDIEQVFKEREREDVTFADCNLCLRCVEYCPEDDALRATFLGKTIYRSSRKGFFSRQGTLTKNSDSN
ncbi:4Fe-4S ferredoxin [Desulfosarcina ovata subsp. sediminis]|uniref:4Fe-4S ferredoxin n=1 Tax=Desulfosarcina ovata subsp. sediminis TaxID=885957 RepID=A0A5K7ZLK1_9BACT|nr:4Fe-4S binding protein [Desulfosarcina ovata]BBO81956.1 4Fe-4S ferredoxin [Desulfosarcina ovata subsp. sediminis]